MGRPIDEEEAINAILREYNKDDSDYPTDYQRGLHAAKKIIEKLPSAQTDAPDTDGDMISRKLMHDLGATCIARRDDDGKLIALGRIDMLPSAQLEIIRCKDCKDYQTDWKTSYPNRHYCATMDSMMPEDGFCSYAERRTDE